EEPMRRLWFVSLFAVLACSEPDTTVRPAQVNWIEWPAEVVAATPFTVRLVGSGGDCRQNVKFVTTPSVDESAVTFEPYFLVPRGPDECYWAYLDALQTALSTYPSFDTRAAVPGLEAASPRTYEIRAGTNASALNAYAAFPIRTFGDVTVRNAVVTTDRINAGGLANATRNTLGCVTLWPYGVYPGYVIENPPADTATY